MRRKGISPLIATVLLIAFVVGIGGLVSLFATSLTTSSTGVTSNQSQSVTKCAGAYINVYRVTNTTVFYSNPTGQTITSLTIITSDGSQIVNPSGPSIAPGASNSTIVGVNTTNPNGYTGLVPGGATGNTSVTMRGLCQSTVPVEGTCKQGQGCWSF